MSKHIAAPSSTIPTGSTCGTDRASPPPSTRRTARSRTSGEYLVDVFICPFLPKTQRVESPGFPGRFTSNESVNRPEDAQSRGPAKRTSSPVSAPVPAREAPSGRWPPFGCHKTDYALCRPAQRLAIAWQSGTVRASRRVIGDYDNSTRASADAGSRTPHPVVRLVPRTNPRTLQRSMAGLIHRAESTEGAISSFAVGPG